MLKLKEEPYMRYMTFRYCAFIFILAVLLYFLLVGSLQPPSCFLRQTATSYPSNDETYVDKYPLTDPKPLVNGLKYKLAVIADLDEERSKSPGKEFEWKSYLTTGFLHKYSSGNYKVHFTKTVTMTSTLNEKGRGLELSELCVFNGGLYSVDDRTGIVYKIVKNQPIPWVILMDGDGLTRKGFKSEWMTVRKGFMYIGSIGKEWTKRTGEFINYYPMFVKRISPSGSVEHMNWTDNYLAMRKTVGITFPGYIVHEAAMWSNVKGRWYFLPRRMSKEKYVDTLDEIRGTNVLISASFDFTDINYVFLEDLDKTHGFSSFKFVPGTSDDVAVALKTKEVGDEIRSYVTVFNVNTGHVIMHEVLLANEKYEGIEFI